MLLRGHKGSAKTTLARGLAGLLGRFVELPLGATEDRVVGSLDLAAALTGGELTFRPGLLAAAHGGVLYVDEINLLADHLVDVLLDVAVSGVNLVERDGVSHRHPARFVLVGSMNPEEGELRPQLLDRFGLCVDVTAPDRRRRAGRSRAPPPRPRPWRDGDDRTFAAADDALAATLGVGDVRPSSATTCSTPPAGWRSPSAPRACAPTSRCAGPPPRSPGSTVAARRRSTTCGASPRWCSPTAPGAARSTRR